MGAAIRACEAGGTGTMEPIEQLDVLVPTLTRLAGGTTPSQLDDPTPCSEWKVRDLFAHLLGGGTTFAALVRGEEPGDVPDPPDEDLAAAVIRAAAALDGAFRGPGAMERVVRTPFGEMPGEAFARVLSFDLLMHVWDLATATGQPLDVPDDVVAEIDGLARATLTPDLRTPGLFGPEVPPPGGASALERLVAFSGRTP